MLRDKIETVQDSSKVLEVTERIFALCFFLLLLPLFAFIAGIIFLTDGLPVFFTQERMGEGGKTFKIYKFRTMKHKNQGPAITSADDPRVTPIGKFLRRYHIDELPQLINIIKGEMSFVGPRPEVPEFRDAFRGEFRKILSVKPGITGPSQLAFRNEGELLRKAENVEEYYRGQILPEKLKIDLDYVKKKSVKEDLKIILETFRKLLRS